MTGDPRGRLRLRGLCQDQYQSSTAGVYNVHGDNDLDGGDQTACVAGWFCDTALVPDVCHRALRGHNVPCTRCCGDTYTAEGSSSVVIAAGMACMKRAAGKNSDGVGVTSRKDAPPVSGADYDQPSATFSTTSTQSYPARVAPSGTYHPVY